MVEKIMQENTLLHHLYHKFLIDGLPQSCPSFTAEAFSLNPHKIEGNFFDIFQPSSHLVDIVAGYVPLPQPYSLIVATAVKFSLRRFYQTRFNGYQFNRNRLWEKSLLSPQEIIESVQKELTHSLHDLNISVPLFYGRINLMYNTLTYLNCEFETPFQINKRQEVIPLEQGGPPLGTTLHPPPSQPINALINQGDWLIFYLNKKQELEEGKTPSLYNCVIETVKNHFQFDAPHVVKKLQERVNGLAWQEDLENHHLIIAIKIKENQAMAASPLIKEARFSSDLSQLQAVRSFVLQACQQTPTDSEKWRWALQLVVNEIFCNIVKYSYRDQPKGEIHIESQLAEEGIYFTVSDKGEAFNPAEIKHPDLAGNQENGFGFFIVQQLVDQISYIPKKPLNDWNHLQIFKRYFSQEEQMQFSHYTQDKILIITPNGDNLDAKNAPAFKEGVLELIRTSTLSRLIFDLSKLQFIDSSGLGTFLAIQRTLNTQGGMLKLVHLNKPIRTMFEIVSMNRIFDIFNTVEEALQSFNKA